VYFAHLGLGGLQSIIAKLAGKDEILVCA